MEDIFVSILEIDSAPRARVQVKCFLSAGNHHPLDILIYSPAARMQTETTRPDCRSDAISPNYLLFTLQVQSFTYHRCIREADTFAAAYCILAAVIRLHCHLQSNALWPPQVRHNCNGGKWKRENMNTFYCPSMRLQHIEYQHFFYVRKMCIAYLSRGSHLRWDLCRRAWPTFCRPQLTAWCQAKHLRLHRSARDPVESLDTRPSLLYGP